MTRKYGCTTPKAPELKEGDGYMEFDVYGYRVHIVFTNDLQASRNKINTLIGGKCDVDGAAAIHASNGNVSHIFFKWDATPEQIAHESWHCIRRLMEYIGATLENEIVAYHIGHLVGAIHNLRKFLRKTKAESVVQNSIEYVNLAKTT